MDAAMNYMRGRDRNYMMRSEKRPGYPNTPPQKPEKDGWYQVLTIVMLVLCCPVGLILLWRRRLRWPGALKLTATILSIVLLFAEVGAALSYPVQDERLKAAQQQANDAVGRVTSLFTGGGADRNDPDVGKETADDPTNVPPMTLQTGSGNAGDGSSQSGESTATDLPSANMLDRPTPGADETVTDDPNATPTPVPPVTPTPTPTATPIADETPAPTDQPTVDPASIPQLQSPGEITVWHTSDGKWYHKASTCGTMSNAKEHTLESAVRNGKKACPYCYPPETQWATEDRPTVYVSTDGYWHTRTSCESNTDEWTARLLDDARANASLKPCDACGARYYENGVPSALTGDSDESSTVGEEAQNAVLELQAVSEITVWHTSNGKWYHKGETCGSMSNASAHTLKSAVLNGKTACPYCHPVAEEWANETAATVYVSGDSQWHVSPACRANTGDWTPMLMSDALTDGSLTACKTCGADRYTSGASAVQSSTGAAGDVQDGLNLADVTNGDALVYYSDNTSHYHRYAMCASSTNTTFVPHKLMDALLANKLACPVCEPPEPETK